VTTAAVRLARHITKRDHVAVRGYHGWHTWTTENNNGVTFNEQEDTSRGIIGYPEEYEIENCPTAALIIEPEFFNAAALQRMRDACDKTGTLLVFDEIITGFRCGMGGLQKVHGVIPDLSTFGKAMANGMPISALVGLQKYMKHMPEISYSGTFFGE